LLQGEDGLQRVSVRAQPAQVVKPEHLVYHARVPQPAAQRVPR
jgi:hypothetical protein